MEKDFLLIMIHYETAFKFKISENKAQHIKTMEINDEVVSGKKKSLLVNWKQSSYRKVALK